MSDRATKEKLDTRLYEVAYLVSPLIAEEAVLGAIDEAIRLPVEKLGGVVTGVTHPKRQVLAYKVGKSINHQCTSYCEAYFGALRFELDPISIAAVKKSLALNELVLRFVTVILPRRPEIVAAPRRPMARRTKLADKVITTAKPELSKEAIDKEIEGLLAEVA